MGDLRFEAGATWRIAHPQARIPPGARPWNQTYQYLSNGNDAFRDTNDLYLCIECDTLAPCRGNAGLPARAFYFFGCPIKS